MSTSLWTIWTHCTNFHWACTVSHTLKSWNRFQRLYAPKIITINASFGANRVREKEKAMKAEQNLNNVKVIAYKAYSASVVSPVWTWGKSQISPQKSICDICDIWHSMQHLNLMLASPRLSWWWHRQNFGWSWEDLRCRFLSFWFGHFEHSPLHLIAEIPNASATRLHRTTCCSTSWDNSMCHLDLVQNPDWSLASSPPHERTKRTKISAKKNLSSQSKNDRCSVWSAYCCGRIAPLESKNCCKKKWDSIDQKMPNINQILIHKL